MFVSVLGFVVFVVLFWPEGNGIRRRRRRSGPEGETKKKEESEKKSHQLTDGTDG
jgi:hypothetical protein